MNLLEAINMILNDYDLTGAIAADEAENPYFDEAMDIHYYMMNIYDSKDRSRTDFLAHAISNILFNNLKIVPDSSLCRGMALEIMELI